jgi:hypothetical protein
MLICTEHENRCGSRYTAPDGSGGLGSGGLGGGLGFPLEVFSAFQNARKTRFND